VLYLVSFIHASVVAAFIGGQIDLMCADYLDDAYSDGNL